MLYLYPTSYFFTQNCQDERNGHGAETKWYIDWIRLEVQTARIHDRVLEGISSFWIGLWVYDYHMLSYLW